MKSRKACCSLVVVGFLTLLSPILGQGNDQWGMLTQQATILAGQGRFADAMPLARQALAFAQTNYSDKSLQYALSLNAIGYIEMATGDLASAQPDLERAVALVTAAVGPSGIQAITPLANLGGLYVQQAQRQSMNPPVVKALLAKAEMEMRQVLSIAEKNFTGTDLNLASPIQALAQVLSMEQSFPEAIQLETRLLTIERANLPPDSQQTVRTRADLASAILASGDTKTALAQFQAILPDAKRILPNDPFTDSIQDIINQLAPGTASLPAK